MAFQRGDSPFTPGQPVAHHLFTGRQDLIQRIMQRGVIQTEHGKPTAFFVTGEYGVGKSSIALYTQRIAVRDHHLVGLYATLGGVKTLQDVMERILVATLESGLYDNTWNEHIIEWLGKYLGKQKAFGFEIDFEALKRETPKIASPASILLFLETIHQRSQKVNQGKGVYLIFDEINGIATNPDFAHFLKGMIDTNAAREPRLPLMLTLCGVEERRLELIRSHEPVNRIFSVLDVDPLTNEEVEHFFQAAFQSVGMALESDALNLLVFASAGQPKVMHEIGECVYFNAKTTNIIDGRTAFRGIRDAASEVGRKYVDPHVYAAIQSEAYKSILKKLANELGPLTEEFTKKNLAAKLNADENKKLNNFLTKMKSLQVLKAGEIRGTYRFTVKMVQMAIWLRSIQSTT
jgi:hypothetical protein